ncbi:nitroreductase [Kitasatospora gansuensis]|uniref:Nitroreductase n=1 Tax=Kitasatospora gansuensis TaxID=258050 RepID=A0A7W7SJK4_9ACTN|nr:nitroreductase family protein [Kitasatospora gansuensis]MBB4951651.1 nitroreductase [Kitasatospora gansuensis]
MDVTHTLDAAALEQLLSAAVAAPSVHNSQPWRFRLRPETSTLEVRARSERALPAADPEGRALHISVGAAVLNLRTAARHHGWAAEVRLLPDPAAPDLLATVALSRSARPEPLRTAELFEAIRHRHTIRTPFTGETVPHAVLDELVLAAQAEGALLHLPDRQETERLLALTAEAERRNTTDPAHRDESRAWIQGPGSPPYGIPVTALGPQDASGHLPMRDFAAIRPAEHLPPAGFEAEPCIAVLTTAHDRPADWLRAGLALEHVLLAATVHQVRASMLHQAMEWPQLRWEARDPAQGPEHVQMLIRLGYGPEGTPTPRLPVSEVLDTDA